MYFVILFKLKILLLLLWIIWDLSDASLFRKIYSLKQVTILLLDCHIALTIVAMDASSAWTVDIHAGSYNLTLALFQ